MLIRIIDAGNTRAVDALLAPRRDDDSAVARRVARIVDDVRRDGDVALRRYSEKFDQLTGAFEVPRENWRAESRRAPAEVRAALQVAARNIARVARAQLPRPSRVAVAPGITVEQRVRPLDSVGCYVPGGRHPLPSSLLMTAIPARVAGVGDVIAVCPRPEPVVVAAALAAGVTRLFQIGGAQAIAALAYGTASVPRVDRIVGPGNKYVAAAKNYVAGDVGIDMQAGPSEILVLSATGRPAWLAADLIAQAEHDPDARAILVTWKRPLAAAVAKEVERQMPVDGPARAALRDHGGIIVTDTREAAIDLANRMAPEHLVVDDERTAAKVNCAGSIFIGPFTAQVAGDYAIGFEPRPADRRRRAGARRAARVGFRSRRVGAARHASRPRPAGADSADSGPRRGAHRTRGVDCREGPVMEPYARPAPTGDSLRLHLNENTAGCSPKVLEALAALSATDVAFYPDYDAVYRETAHYLRVPEDRLLLVNGLDEGILMAALVALQGQRADGVSAEYIVVNPAFDMYAITARAVGGAVVNVAPRPDFAFPLQGVLEAITGSTRLAFLTSPNNPTGVRVGNDDIRLVARAVPKGALVFVDEAYHDFCGDTALPLLDECPNVVVGRTFAKAQGLAALRVGALMATPATLAHFKHVTPPYSLNVAAAVALRAAIADTERLRWYVGEVTQSRELMTAFCARHDFETWPSGANFVLARVGDQSAALVKFLAARGIVIRDKSGDPGCDGCIRVTTGVVAATEQCVAVMEEFLCGAR